LGDLFTAVLANATVWPSCAYNMADDGNVKERQKYVPNLNV
jgi:hypothetical protein